MIFNYLRGSFLLVLMMMLSSKALASNDIDVDSTNEVGQCQFSDQSKMLSNQLLSSVKENYFRQLGSAKFSVLFWDIYQSRLLTSDGRPPFSNHCQQALFEIHYLRDISQQELVENTISQWRHLALNESDYIDFVPLLESIWPDIKAGDELAMLSGAGTTVFYLNQQSIGMIENQYFAKLFLGIWLDENTSEPKLRRQLLGETT